MIFKSISYIFTAAEEHLNKARDHLIMDYIDNFDNKFLNKYKKMKKLKKKL
jgi:hypothetical protein